MGIADAVGGLLGSKSKDVKSSTTAKYPKELRPAFGQYGSQLNAFMQNPGNAFQQYQGPVYADTSPYTMQGISALAQPQYWNQAGDYLGATARGDYLGLNPQMQQAVMNPAIEAVNARFNQLGRYGSQANVDTATKGAMEALMPYYGMERGYQQQAASALPGIGTGYAQSLLGAGQAQTAVNQLPINQAMAAAQQQNYSPQQAALQAYGGLLGPGQQAMTSNTTTSTPGGSPLAGALGLGLMGVGLYSGMAPLMGGGAAAGGAGLLGGGMASGNGINAMFPGYRAY